MIPQRAGAERGRAAVAKASELGEPAGAVLIP